MSVSRTYFRYSRTVKWITGSCLALIVSLSLLGVFQFEGIYESYRNSIFHTIAFIIQGVPYSEIKDSVRVFGSGGYFGYIGLFKITRSNRICRFYLTNKDGELIKLIDKAGKRDIYISG